MIDNKLYYIKYIDRLFNILIKFENKSLDFPSYIRKMAIEAGGNNDFVEMKRISYMLNGLLLCEVEHKDVRGIVLDSIDIIDKLLSNWDIYSKPNGGD